MGEARMDAGVLRNLQRRLYARRVKAEQGCVVCGERDPDVLEFDHRDPDEKIATISFMVAREKQYPDRVLLSEIKKCDVVCANCHARRTAKQFGYYWWACEVPFRDIEREPFERPNAALESPERPPRAIKYVREEVTVPVGAEEEFAKFWGTVLNNGKTFDTDDCITFD